MEDKIKEMLEKQRKVAESFYIAKEKGILPYAKIYYDSNGAKRVDVVVGNFKLCFHATRFNNQTMEIRKVECDCGGENCNRIYYYIPFDGTESGNYEQFT